MKGRIFLHILIVTALFVVLVIAMFAFYPRITLLAKYSLFLAYWMCSLYLLLRNRFRASVRGALIGILSVALAIVSKIASDRVFVSRYAPCIVPVYSLYYQVATEKPRVALTFDDGPCDPSTQKILDVLKADNVHATFFILGCKVNEQRETIERMARDGHEIGNHSWNHPCLSALSSSKLQWQITKTNDAIRSVTGQKEVLFRPPYGSLTWLQGGLCKKYHIASVIYWNSHLDSVKDENAILQQVRPGSIILMHDSMSTPEHVDFVVRTLQKHGYEVVTVSELMENK